MSGVEDRLAEIMALADAATDGPWRVTRWHDKGVMPAGWADDSLPIAERGPFAHIAASEVPDAAFIAAARTLVPELVAALRAVLKIADFDSWASDEVPRRYPDLPRPDSWGDQVRATTAAALGVTP